MSDSPVWIYEAQSLSPRGEPLRTWRNGSWRINSSEWVEHGPYTLAQDHSELVALQGERFFAVGFVYQWACSMHDAGRDPGEFNLPELERMVEAALTHDRPETP